MMMSSDEQPSTDIIPSDFATAVNSSRSNIIHPSTDSETDDSWQEINPRKKTKRSNNVEMPTDPREQSSRPNLLLLEMQTSYQKSVHYDEVIDEVIAQFVL
ncbi:unnamed protein product [Acanthoscelides obtectus]|uniref:Uncharacterized protein n=1 Tax=Acanthoscelides obtectus TaxID=200917 RepID=A0A9P0LJJ0_ACAOB|nr:unnamed protein product [Acanthoscelides obtectus]CAK1657249.1 hypothetical protein AOBTE_LOCUS20245 [Acanthoscelides obtectus]